MAATRLIALHINKGKTIAQTLADRTDYSKNEEKTEGGKYVSSYLLYLLPTSKEPKQVNVMATVLNVHFGAMVKKLAFNLEQWYKRRKMFYLLLCLLHLLKTR